MPAAKKILPKLPLVAAVEVPDVDLTADDDEDDDEEEEDEDEGEEGAEEDGDEQEDEESEEEADAEPDAEQSQAKPRNETEDAEHSQEDDDDEPDELDGNGDVVLADTQKDTETTTQPQFELVKWYRVEVKIPETGSDGLQCSYAKLCEDKHRKELDPFYEADQNALAQDPLGQVVLRWAEKSKGIALGKLSHQAPQKRRRRHEEDEYDIEDPWIDDSETVDERQYEGTSTLVEGFYIYRGAVPVEEDANSQKKEKGKRGRKPVVKLVGATDAQSPKRQKRGRPPSRPETVALRLATEKREAEKKEAEQQLSQDIGAEDDDTEDPALADAGAMSSQPSVGASVVQTVDDELPAELNVTIKDLEQHMTENFPKPSGKSAPQSSYMHHPTVEPLLIRISESFNKHHYLLPKGKQLKQPQLTEMFRRLNLVLGEKITSVRAFFKRRYLHVVIEELRGQVRHQEGVLTSVLAKHLGGGGALVLDADSADQTSDAVKLEPIVEANLKEVLMRLGDLYRREVELAQTDKTPVADAKLVLESYVTDVLLPMFGSEMSVAKLIRKCTFIIEKSNKKWLKGGVAAGSNETAPVVVE